jgi:hypothetical protein
VNSETTTGGPATWPVLAQLPRVGIALDARRAGNVTMSARDESQQRIAFDPPHMARNDDERPVAAAAPNGAAAQQISEKSPAKLRQFRIDQGAARRPPTGHAPSEPATLVGQAFQLHQALAPHRGLMGAAALVLSGGLLVWLACGPAPHAANSPGASLFGGAWSSESATQTHAPDAGDPAANNSGIATAPRVAAAAATPPSAMSSPSRQPQATQPVEPTADGPAISPAEPADAGSNQSAATSASEPITPTIDASAYPITPYPAFPFAEPQAVAELMSPPGVAPPR